MKAILSIDNKLSWSDAPRPDITPHAVRIKVFAAGINRADLVQRAGHYPPPPGVTDILGLECFGTVIETGKDVVWPTVGEQVCALLSGGGYAEEVVIPAAHALPIPRGLDLLQAAALPEVFTTAWLNLKWEGELKEKERVLVHAGASGVGTAVVQLCAAWNNPVCVTVGSQKKCERARALGAELAVNRKDGPWGPDITAKGKFDMILDPVGGNYLEQNIHALNPCGRLVCIGLLGGPEGTLPLARLLSKRLQIKGSVLRSRSDSEKSEILKAMKNDTWPLLESAKIAPIIDSVYPMEQVEEAHKRLQTNDTIGKVLLKNAL